MNKAKVTSPDVMIKGQLRQDISMTPLQRLDLAFQMSDFALEFQNKGETSKQGSTSIQWLELQNLYPKMKETLVEIALY